MMSKSAFYRMARLSMIEMREELGMTQTEFAEYVGLSQPTISRIESGVRVPSLYEYTIAKSKTDEGANREHINRSNHI